MHTPSPHPNANSFKSTRSNPLTLSSPPTTSSIQTNSPPLALPRVQKRLRATEDQKDLFHHRHQQPFLNSCSTNTITASAEAFLSRSARKEGGNMGGGIQHTQPQQQKHSPRPLSRLLDPRFGRPYCGDLPIPRTITISLLLSLEQLNHLLRYRPFCASRDVAAGRGGLG